jgi:hypothetical protein
MFYVMEQTRGFLELKMLTWHGVQPEEPPWESSEMYDCFFFILRH